MSDKAKKALAIGVSQTGKSTFALHWTLATGKQAIIWDANEVFIDIVRSPVYTPEDLSEALINREPIIVYDATGARDKFLEFERFAAVLENFDNHSLLVDEAGDIQSAQRANPGMDRLYRRAGRRNNDIIETTHRPQQIAVLNRSLTTDVYIFGVSRGKDVKALSDEFSEEAAQAAAQLPDHVYIHYFARTGEWLLVNDPQAWYIDLNSLYPEREQVDVDRKRPPLFENNEVLYGEEV